MSADDPELTVTLPRSVWVAAAELLAQLPYGEVATLLETLAEQLNPQIRAAAEESAGTEPRAN
jgi:hypothetical protein